MEEYKDRIVGVLKQHHNDWDNGLVEDLFVIVEEAYKHKPGPLDNIVNDLFVV